MVYSDELHAEIDAAWLRSEAMPLQFEVDPQTGRVHAELRGKRLSAREALLVACGDAVA
jgi:hypothetical protein